MVMMGMITTLERGISCKGESRSPCRRTGSNLAI